MVRNETMQKAKEEEMMRFQPELHLVSSQINDWEVAFEIVASIPLQNIRRIQQKYEIPIVQRIRSVLLRTGRIDDQEDSGEEASFNPPQDNRALIFLFEHSSTIMFVCGIRVAKDYHLN
ncbi:hypothetical protein R6Q59_002311 [Mikania micrantha]